MLFSPFTWEGINNPISMKKLSPSLKFKGIDQRAILLKASFTIYVFQSEMPNCTEQIAPFRALFKFKVEAQKRSWGYLAH